MMVSTTPQSQKAGGLNLIAEVEQDVFWALLKKMDHPIVLTVRSGMPKMHKYVTRYNGYYFVTKSKEPLEFLQAAEVIPTTKIHLTPEWPKL